MASQPPPLNEMEETSKTVTYKDSMSPQEIAEMLRQHDLQTRLHPALVQNFNMMKLNNSNLHGKDSQNIASISSRFSANSYQDLYNTVIKTCSADFTTSNMVQLSQQALQVNERPHTPFQSSEKTPKEIHDLPQPLIDFNKLRNSTSFSKFQNDKIQEQSKAPMTLAPGEIPQSSKNFKKACISHLLNNIDLNEEAHNDINQEASDEPSYSSVNFDPQQKIYRDIQKYHPINPTGGYYRFIELNKEFLDVNTTSFNQSELQVPQHEQEHSDMMWLQRAWLTATEALSAGKVWKRVQSEQKAAFDRAIVYRAQHKELNSSILRLQIDKFTARILFIIEGLQAPACSPTIVDLKNILRGSQSFNTLSYEKCNMLMAAQRHHNKHELIDSPESETLRSAPEKVRSIQSTQPDTSNHREEDSSWKDSMGRITQQPMKHCSSDLEPKGFEGLHQNQATFTGEDCSPALLSGVHMQINAQSAVAVNPDDIINVGNNDIRSGNEDSIDGSLYSDENMRVPAWNICNVRQTRLGTVRGHQPNANVYQAASDDFSFVAIFQEKLDALKTIDQKCQDQRAPLIQGTNIDLNSGDAISQEASRASERKWYLERKAYLETLREREGDARRNDATSLDCRDFKKYRHLTSPELNEMREAKNEFQASIADAYSSYLAARRAKDDACMKLETAIAERKALWMENIHKPDNPRFKKECSNADKNFLECHMERKKRVSTFNAIKHASQQKHKNREAFEKRIELLNRSSGDNITQKIGPAKNDSAYATFAADHHSARVTLARLEAHYTAQSAKAELQPLRTIDDAWTDGNYGFLEQSKHDQKQRNNSILSNDYITVQEHAQGLRGNYDQSASQPFLSRPDNPPAITGQYPNPDSRNYYSVKSTDRAEYMTMFKEWKPNPKHLDITNAMILDRTARGRQLAGQQPGKFGDAMFQHLRQWGYSRPDAPIDTAYSATLASSALDLLAVKGQGQCAPQVADKEVVMLNNANDTFTETSRATNILTSTVNEHNVMANKLVTDTIEITKKFTDIDIATVDELTDIADKAFVEATKNDGATTSQQTVNSEVNSSSETTANAEMTNIENLALNELLISDTDKSDILSKDMMQNPKQEFDLEYDSDLQSDASWAIAGDDDHNVVAEASGLKELESLQESEEAEEWQML
ncbi:uncharacterized protein Bfra_011478 [Botrytis fragariae]|uniref:Uncharacterized protein n=1 Tax=Botrytis fragariae TaxID=1964551 RepID=A0A8H6EKZ0_9HELO|nr:uncharacterized protein Bfra_011478 [Botrytis fragariae]KAF5875715.1 hypothetical protein Bfra_011478 [Botrytis fragariae]